MGKRKCPDCGGAMIKYGKTKAGSQRWQCPRCKSTATGRNDNAAKLLELFLSWLLSGKTQGELSVSARTFRRKCARFWEVWPMPPVTGEVHRVVFVDGIRVAKNVHVLIACTEEHVVGWYLARSENSRSWGALMRKTPPPEAVVCDGGSGFEKTRKRHWPQTRVQRCLFHVFGQVKKQTTTRPKLQAGADPQVHLELVHCLATVEGARDEGALRHPLFNPTWGHRRHRVPFSQSSKIDS